MNISESIKTIEELSSSKLDMEVSLIEWSDDKKNERESYLWVLDMCKTFGSDIKEKPEILNILESNIYSCKFKKDNRKLEINNLNKSVYFSLTYDTDYMDKKNEKIDEKIRKLKLKDILKK